MAKLSERDKGLSAESQKAILQAKSDWEAANSEYQNAKDDASRTAARDKMTAANNAANAVRSKEGNYTAGASGTEYIPNAPSSGGNSSFASGGGGGGGSGYSLSATDKAMLNDEQQKQILALKEKYAQAAAAGADTNTLTGIHNEANAIRANAGYSGGTSGNDYVVLAYGQGGKSADEIRAEMDQFEQKWWKPVRGWTNGYDVSMNTRSRANRIRQQMHANETAMNGADKETRELLHNENLALAQVLYDHAGHGEETTYYNDKLGRWETWNPNVGYGYNMNAVQPNIRNSQKQYYGYTDEEIDNWAKDTSHYYNFVDVKAPARNTIDESSGFTGQYAQFVNGPYAQLMWGTSGWQSNDLPWVDSIGDNFGSEGTFVSELKYDENGNIIKTPPALKNNNSASAYSRQFVPTTVNGLLVGRGAPVSAMDPTATDSNIEGQREYYNNYGRYARGGGAGAGGGGMNSYLEQMYAAALQSQLNALESSYKQNISELDANVGKLNDTYTEQKRQTTGTSEQNAAAWREMANAMGLNTGAMGQAALSQNNQLQSNLNALENAEAAALTEIERQKALLGQQYQLQINQAIADNDFQKAQALYNEAVRAEEQLIQKQQYASQMALQYAQLAQNQYQYENDLALQYAKAGLRMPGSGGSDDYIPVANSKPTPLSEEDVSQDEKDSAFRNRLARAVGNRSIKDPNFIGKAILNANDSGELSDQAAYDLFLKYGLETEGWFE